MQREGPPNVSLVKFDSSSLIKINGLEADNQSSSFETVRADVLVRGGKWYYEVKLGTNGRMQIGWCTTKCHYGPNSLTGVGQDAQSWSYDGSSQKAWHGSTSASIRYGEYWGVGDIIGVILDLETKTISFYRNGKDLGVAFSGVEGESFYPSISLHRRQKVSVNFGKQAFKYSLQEIFPDLHALQLKLTPEQQNSLEKLFQHYKGLGEDSMEDVITGDGLLQYGQDLGITAEDDPSLMIVAWKCYVNHEKSWEMNRNEFVGGWTLHGCYSIDTMKKKLKDWKEEIKQPNKFKQFYYYVFDYLREDKKILSIEECVTVWGMLGIEKRWPLYSSWLRYLEGKKSVSRDTWRLFANFMEQYPKDLSNYDPDGCWPSVIDEFVDWTKENK